MLAPGHTLLLATPACGGGNVPCLCLFPTWRYCRHCMMQLIVMPDGTGCCLLQQCCHATSPSLPLSQVIKRHAIYVINLHCSSVCTY
jgi:hypothetical protein